MMKSYAISLFIIFGKKQGLNLTKYQVYNLGCCILHIIYKIDI